MTQPVNQPTARECNCSGPPHRVSCPVGFAKAMSIHDIGQPVKIKQLTKLTGQIDRRLVRIAGETINGK